MNPLESAKAELADLIEKRAEIDRRIYAMQQTIQILEPVYGDDQQARSIMSQMLAIGLTDDAGLTDRIRRLLQVSTPGSVTPTAIRDLLVKTGFNAEGRSNFLAEIHNILKRLVAQGDAEEVSRDDGSKGYRAIDKMTANRYAAYLAAASSDPITNPSPNLRRGSLKDLMGGRRRPIPSMPPPEQPLPLTSPEDEQKKKK